MLFKKGYTDMGKNYPKIDMYRTGQNIKRIMQKRGLTVRDIQDYLGLSAQQSIYHWFEGRSMPSVDNLYALSGLFHVPVDDMLCGSRKEQFYFCKNPCRERLYVYYLKCLELKAG